MKKIVFWKIKEGDGQELDVGEIQSVQETQTENQLEEVITLCPALLMEDLKLIGRQTETPGGPLDLLGVDSDGNLVVFELKRGALTREAVAQIVDYSSHLATLEPQELSEHISSRSGKLDKVVIFFLRDKLKLKQSLQLRHQLPQKRVIWRYSRKRFRT